MSMPYSPTSPRMTAMSDFRSDQTLPPITKLPDVFPHARPQSPPTSPESAAGSSHSSPKRRMSDQNELHDLLDRNRRKRSATSIQVLGPIAAAREQADDVRREPRLPSPRGTMRPDDRPQLPPLQTYLRSCQTDVDVPPRPLARRDSDDMPGPDRSRPGAMSSSVPRLPPIVTSDYTASGHSRPLPTEPVAYASKISYSTSRSALSSPYSTSPTSYGAPSTSFPSTSSTPYRRSERELPPPPTDPSRSHSLSAMAGEPAKLPYEPYVPADRRYSTGYIPPHTQRAPGAPAGPHYSAMAPPASGGSEVPAHYVWEMPVAAINPNGRKRRGNLPKESTSILNEWFCQHIAFPYPKEDEKHQLQAMTGLSISQISNWFINARRRRRPETVMRQSQAQYEEPPRWKPNE